MATPSQLKVWRTLCATAFHGRPSPDLAVAQEILLVVSTGSAEDGQFAPGSAEDALLAALGFPSSCLNADVRADFEREKNAVRKDVHAAMRARRERHFLNTLAAAVGRGAEARQLRAAGAGGVEDEDEDGVEGSPSQQPLVDEGGGGSGGGGGGGGRGRCGVESWADAMAVRSCMRDVARQWKANAGTVPLLKVRTWGMCLCGKGRGEGGWVGVGRRCDSVAVW